MSDKGTPHDGLIKKALRDNKLGRDVKTVLQSVAQREHWAEEYECAMMHLSDLGVPKDDGKGNTYSLVGRIDKAISHPTNDAKKMLLRERVAELACAELDKEYAYKMFSHFKGSGEPVEKQVTALEYFQNEALEEIRKELSKSNEQEG